MPATDRPPTPAQHRAALLRVEADLAAAERRAALLALEIDMGTHPDPEALEVKLLEAVAVVAELEERRAALEGTPTAAPPPGPAAPMPEYLDTRGAAALLGVSVKGLEGMRARGKGPPFVRVGRRIRYRRSDLR